MADVPAVLALVAASNLKQLLSRIRPTAVQMTVNVSFVDLMHTAKMRCDVNERVKAPTIRLMMSLDNCIDGFIAALSDSD